MLSRQLREMKSALDQRAKTRNEVVVGAILLFLVSVVLLFLGMHRYPDVYDEGLLLTGAMRVAAGQIPHRDFYAIYGPADFFVPAMFFKIFGQSLLVDRLLNLFVEGLTVATTFALASFYCRRSIAIGTAIVALLWLDGLNTYICSAVFPVALLNLASCALLLPLFSHTITKKRLLAAGLLAGLSTLYRYDTGAAILGIQICVLAIASFIQSNSSKRKVQRFLSFLWPYLSGFALLTVPALIYFLSVSPFHPLLLDVVLLQSRNYQRGRSLPFPGLHLKTLDVLAVYLPILVITLCVYVLRVRGLKPAPIDPEDSASSSEEMEWRGLLLTFSLLAFVMFFKGYVRVGTLPMFTSLLPSMVLTGILFEHRRELPRAGRVLLNFICCFFVFTAFCSIARSTIHILKEGSIPGRIIRSLAGGDRADRSGDNVWCKLSSPLMRGFCFSTDQGRRLAIEFIDAHTDPNQRLFVGTTRHDKIYINDNLFYFAAQRLPATMWSHFDPGLQNSEGTQLAMIQELEETGPPYIVLDSEFDTVTEPNDSAKSSGVHLLDDFIHSRYHLVQTFDEMSVWQRIAPLP